MSDQVAEISDSSFEQDILQSDTPAIVDFWASWCAPCRLMAPVIDELAEKFQGKVKFAKLNVDDNPQTPAKYSIRSIPTLLFIQGGNVVNQTIGVTSSADLESKINEMLG